MTISQIIPPFPLKRHFIVCSRGEKERTTVIFDAKQIAQLSFFYISGLRSVFIIQVAFFVAYGCSQAPQLNWIFVKWHVKHNRTKKCMGKLCIQFSLVFWIRLLSKVHIHKFSRHLVRNILLRFVRIDSKSTSLEKESFSCFLIQQQSIYFPCGFNQINWGDTTAIDSEIKWVYDKCDTSTNSCP